MSQTLTENKLTENKQSAPIEIEDLESVGDWNVDGNNVGLPRRLSRVYSLIRYHRPAQFLTRAAKLARREMLNLNGGGAYATWPEKLPGVRDNPGLAAIAERKAVAREGLESRRWDDADGNHTALELGRFRFLNREVIFPSRLPWDLSGHDLSALWRFHFHSHEFLLDKAVSARTTGELATFEEIWNFVLAWIDGNAMGQAQRFDDAWHPFCTSKRLPVWITLWQESRPAVQYESKILASIVQQARFLNGNFEWDLGGNHLLENLRGLSFAAAFLDNPESEQWLKKVRQILPLQLSKQILPHGEHFERSPMYHALMLEVVLDIRDLLESLDQKVSVSCADAAIKMADFLNGILHPDGDIPLFGDSAFGEAPSPSTLIDAAGIPRSESERSPGAGATMTGPYWVWTENACSRLIFDAGDVAADDLPAHAHCDLLNFEASVNGDRLIVDSGVFNYEDDWWRHYCRSTAAHNVLQVDGVDQCDVWSRFRMGRRGRVTEVVSGEENGFSWIRASHDAYRHIGVPTTTRWIACRRGGPWLIVDRAAGRGVHRLTNRLHLHPDAEIGSLDGNRVVVLWKGSEVRIDALGKGKLVVRRGWFCPEFGKRQEAVVLEWETLSTLPALVGWCLMFDNRWDIARLTNGADEAVSITQAGAETELLWKLPL